MDATVRDAITVCIDRKLNGMMVVDKSDMAHRRGANSTSLELKQKCVGLITSRDILRVMAASIKAGKTSDEILDERISNIMKPIDRVIYGRPDETIATCRAIMAKNGIQCLPILAEGRVEGILTARDMQDVYFDAKDRGGKKNYLRDISDRVGLSSDLTSMVSDNTRMGLWIRERSDLAMLMSPVHFSSSSPPEFSFLLLSHQYRRILPFSLDSI